jgi:transposase
MSNNSEIKRLKYLKDFKEILPKYTNKLPNEITSRLDTYECNSWFNIKRYNVNSVSNNLKYKNRFPKEVISCQKVKMLLTTEQKLIINNWMEAYTKMYNEGVQYIRNKCNTCYTFIVKNKLTEVYKFTNFQNLRNNLKDIKHNILINSQLKTSSKNTKIHIHTLDYALRQLTSNIKSAVTNLQRNHIKRFRIKYWHHNRISKSIDIEKQSITKNKICPKILGDIQYEYNKKPYILPKISSNVKINYNSILNEYTLLIPIKNKPEVIPNKPNNIIILDPGLRTFMTGLSENNAYAIASNVNKRIKIKIEKLNKIKSNEKIPLSIKQKNEKIINRKIHNQVDDLHWKVISYLTKNFQNVLLGDMSAKSIVQKGRSVLSNDSKTACLRTRYYVFRQRLEYKCKLTKTNFKLVDEYYTSKTCSNCGNYNPKLKCEKEYNCSNCKFELDRDINACRNMMIKSLI